MNLNNHSIISPNLSTYNKFNPKLRVAILASGEGTNFQSIVDLSRNNTLDVEIMILITDNENSGCIKRANKYKIPFKVLKSTNNIDKKLFEEKIVQILREKNIELVVMAGWMKIISPYFVNSYQNRIINIHPSILPSYKGLNAIKTALNNGSKITGCTVHYVVPEVDSGKIIIQAALEIKDSDSLESLSKRIHELEHKILPYAISEAGLYIRDNFMGKSTKG